MAFGSDNLSDLAKPIKVSELVAMLKNDVEHKHRHVRVVGEISSFKQWRSGHCYFDIKDETALLPAVMFRPHFARVPFVIADGLQVLFSGRLSVYAANARLQMIVETMEPLGQGALALAFEQLKERLRKEGLFDAHHKKPIKAFNRCVGLITSSHGAVLRDMVRILKTRMPKVDILFSPVRVQGGGAASEIALAIHLLDQMGACDVIIVGRGGGSLEDLWAFNEEQVARAIFRAKTPIISAVGHETDITISDFVADIRAATPTHAATMVVPNLADITAFLAKSYEGLCRAHHAHIRRQWLAIASEKRRLGDPRVLLFRHWQQVDDMGKKLSEKFKRIFNYRMSLFLNYKKILQKCAPFRQLRTRKDTVFALKSVLLKNNPQASIQLAKNQQRVYKKALEEVMCARMRSSKSELAHCCSTLDALSPLRVIARGYSVVQAAEGQRVLSKIEDFSMDQHVRIFVEDGVIGARIESLSMKEHADYGRNEQS